MEPGMCYKVPHVTPWFLKMAVKRNGFLVLGYWLFLSYGHCEFS